MHFRIVTYSILLVVSVHWCACLYRLVVLLEDDADNNWIKFYFGTMDVSPGEVDLSSGTLFFSHRDWGRRFTVQLFTGLWSR